MESSLEAAMDLMIVTNLVIYDLRFSQRWLWRELKMKACETKILETLDVRKMTISYSRCVPQTAVQIFLHGHASDILFL
jgi:hypothetical protein